MVTLSVTKTNQQLQSWIQQENERKRKYEQRIFDAEMGTFTHLVYSSGTNGVMGAEC